jgi:peptide deformylase
MLLEIAQYGNPVLKEKCRPVEHFDDSLKTLAENMLETMYAAEGIGLAAPR